MALVSAQTYYYDNSWFIYTVTGTSPNIVQVEMNKLRSPINEVWEGPVYLGNFYRADDGETIDDGTLYTLTRIKEDAFRGINGIKEKYT